MFYLYMLRGSAIKRTKFFLIIFFFFLAPSTGNAQAGKILFDASKAETAGNADWVIDSDLFNLGFGTGPAVLGGGNESNPQRIPTPAQSGITAATAETYWKGALSAWGIDCVKKGYTVETLPYNGVISYGNALNPQDLSNYKVFVVCEPNIIFSLAEKTALLNFVFNGGGLFMVSDHTVSDRNNDGVDSPAIWDDFFTNNGSVSNPFGISFDLANFSETSNNVATLPGDPLLHGIMGNVTQVLWSNGTSITLNTAKNSTVKGVVYRTGSSTTGSTNAMCAYAQYGSGKVVALGDSSPCDDGTGDTNDALFDGYFTDAAGNHQRLIMNATIWLATPSVVPVEFISVSGTVSGKMDLINWEVNEDGSNGSVYSIDRSENGVNFYTIGSLAAHGNSSVASYHFTDFSPRSPLEFYRIIAVESNGRSIYSSMIEIHSTEDFSLKLFPNPVQDMLELRFKALAYPTLFHILDDAGRNLFFKEVNKGVSTLAIPVQKWPAGMYRLTITNNTSLIWAGSFLKVKGQ